MVKIKAINIEAEEIFFRFPSMRLPQLWLNFYKNQNISETVTYLIQNYMHMYLLKNKVVLLLFY